MSKPSLVRTLSKKFGKKDEAGNDAEEKPAEEKVLARTLSSRFSKQSKTEDAGGEREEKPLKRTLSNKFFGKKDEKTGEDAPEEEKKEGKVLKRTMSNKLFGKKDAASGEDVGDESGGGKPVLSRTSSQRFKKEEKKKLKARFDIRVVRISKCQINNTTVFLGWKRPPGTLGGDTKRAVVTDCCATFGDTISVEAVLSLPPGEEKFKPALILFELKEDKLVRKGAGKAKWHVLGRGQVDLAEYSKANKALCIIPLQKKKANIQLELEVTAVWQHFDGQRFEQMSAASLSAKQPEVVPGAKQKKVEVIGSAKYAVASDSEVDMYTEEDVDLNLSEIASDDDEEDYRSAFAESSNPFERAEEERMAPSSMAAMLSGLAGPPKKQQHESGEKSGEENLKSEEPPRPARAPPKKEAEDPPTPKREPPKMIEERKAAEQPAKQVVTAVVDDSNPFGPPKAVPVAAVEAKPSVPVATTTANTPLAATGSLTTCHDCKRENKNGWRFCDTCGARSKVGGAAEPEKKVEAKPAPSVPAVAAKKEEPAKIERVKKEVVEEEPRGPAVASAATGAMDDLRTLVDQQRREIQALKDNERRFANTIAMAERKVLAAESQLQMKERELKRLAVVASAGGGGGSEGGDSSELMTQVTELEAELMAERRRREFGTMMENLVFLSTFAFTREKESVAALKMFDELIRLSVFDESQAASSAQLVDHLCHTIMMMCQNVRTPQETAQYWVVTAVHLLKLLREGKKRLRSEVNEDHPLAHFERSLCKLATNLYTRLFTFMLRKIESLLIRSLGTPYQSEAYFRPEELAMGEILREFSALLEGFKANHWSGPMIELFFKFCVDLVNRFLANKIIQERQFCTLLNGIRIKMEVSFLSEWLMKHAETENLIGELSHVLEAANVLIMSKGRNSMGEFRTLNVRQIHSILAHYQPQASAASSGAGFAVVPPGLSKHSQEIVERLEKAKGGAALQVADQGDAVDPKLLRRLEEDPAFPRCEITVPDRLAEDIERLEAFLQK